MPPSLHKKNCCLLSFFSVAYCNISTMRGGHREQSGKRLPCHMERQSSSQEHGIFENMILSTCTILKGLTAHSTRQQFSLCHPSAVLGMYFRISRCCTATVILQESVLECVSSACPASHSCRFSHRETEDLQKTSVP